MFFSIRWRLVFGYLLVTLVTISVLGLALLFLLDRYFLEQEKEQLQQNAEALASRLGLLLPSGDLSRLVPLVNAYGLLSQARIHILDQRQRPLLDSWLTQGTDALESGDVGLAVIETNRGVGEIAIDFERLSRSSLARERTTFIVDMNSLWGGHMLLETPTPHVRTGSDSVPVAVDLSVQVPIHGPQGIFLGYVQMTREVARGGQLLSVIRSAFRWAGLAALGLAVILGFWMSQNITAPLKALADAAQAMGQGDLRIRAPALRRDEIGQVARQFNQMAESVEQSFAALAADRDALRRFAADASHELRTPIAALKTFNELLQSTARDDPEAQQEFLAESQAQIERLDWLTENLLQLSKLDSGSLEMDIQPASLSELVKSVIASFAPQAEEKKVTLRARLPDEDLIAAYDQRWMQQALGNLVSNAIKFTLSGGSITVGITPMNSVAEIWIEDTGIGISSEDLPHIFERFYRARCNEQPGSGLGLAIAQSVVQAHGSAIRVSSREGRGSRFFFRLPTIPTPSYV